ncbi:hypothetical protein SAMN04487785_106163 [Dyella jiangningensis]|uniref:hypothetical protein n=1 Tax=Dyella sp. AtDHG13 TaxID=1938897 RepID=UPI0008891C30|nr:hypothetical protein [Dyella sp. AtDHG13]PXV59242.1 hypothetical protein BDW41_104288 [Dyella sp. AtDHG13]SDK27162.1 hypothetical protein SAMN04487785_106163 [Dyella jiangningensis]
MPTPDNARQGHAVLSTVLATVALAVLFASVVMWWLTGMDDGSAFPGQTASAAVEASRS